MPNYTHQVSEVKSISDISSQCDPSVHRTGNWSFDSAFNNALPPSVWEGTAVSAHQYAQGFAPLFRTSISNGPNREIEETSTWTAEHSIRNPTRRLQNRKEPGINSAPLSGSASVSELCLSKPRKSDRNPSKRALQSSTSKSSHEDNAGSLGKDPRRQRMLERNRIAATKCRTRKRDEASALISRERHMEDEHRYLSSCFDSLTAEIYDLKMQLLRHSHCECVLIQKYIEIEARRSGGGVLGCSSAFNSYEKNQTSPHSQSLSKNTSIGSVNLPILDLDGAFPVEANPTQLVSLGPRVGHDNLDIYGRASTTPHDSTKMCQIPHKTFAPGFIPESHITTSRQSQAEAMIYNNQVALQLETPLATVM